MSKPWMTLSLLLITSNSTACHQPPPTCEPGAPGCERPPLVTPAPLDEVEARAQLDALHDRFEAAAIDGLDPKECQAIADGYQRLFELDPSLIAARFNVAAVWEACDQHERAETIYVELADREHPQALNNLGALAWSRGQHERAFALFERSVSADRTHAIAARNNLAMALRERYAEHAAVADFEQAEVQLHNILAVDSSNKTAYENLARLYYDRGRLEHGSYLVLANLVVTQAQRVLAANGQHSADLANLRGLLLIEDDDQVRALRAFQRAVEIEPAHVDANRNIAMIAVRFRDYAAAERALETVLGVSEVANDVEVWLALGVAKRGLRNYDAAAEAYHHALEADRNDPRPWYNLGILAQDHRSGSVQDKALTKVYAEALDHYRTFVAQAGTSPRWRTDVAEAKDRIAIVEDSIETIEKMKALEDEMDRIDALAAAAWEVELERRKQLEAAGTRVDEIAPTSPDEDRGSRPDSVTER